MKPLLQLIRLPNVFTVVADIMMGYLFVHPSLQPAWVFLLLLSASVCLYWSGMVLNDLFDLAQDRRERPERPLPSGRVSLGTARGLGWGLLVLGVLAGCSAGYSVPSDMPWRSGALATGVAVCVVAYDAFFKATLVGPLFMGACRMGNILLGMSTGPVIHDYATPFWGFDSAQLAVAGGLGVYVAGVTWFARHEALPRSFSAERWFGIAVMLLGLGWLAFFTLVSVSQAGRYDVTINHRYWPLVVLLLAATVIRRAVAAAIAGTPHRIQTAVRQCILSIIVLDAAVCLAARSPWWWSVTVLSLTVPMLVLGRWFYAT